MQHANLVLAPCHGLYIVFEQLICSLSLLYNSVLATDITNMAVQSVHFVIYYYQPWKIPKRSGAIAK